jgi:hypothetical protein
MESVLVVTLEACAKMPQWQRFKSYFTTPEEGTAMQR